MHNDIDKRFKDLVTENPGIDRKQCMKELSMSTDYKVRSDKSKMDRIQNRSIKKGWLIKKVTGKIITYFCSEYAKNNDIKIKRVQRMSNIDRITESNKDVIKRCHLIDKFWITRRGSHA